MNVSRFGSGQPLPQAPKNVDAAPLLSRMEAMGLPRIRESDIQPGSLSASDVLPWWLLEVHKKDQCRVPLSHLAQLMAQHRLGVRTSGFNIRPMQTFCSGLPIGSAEAQAKAMHDQLMGLVHLVDESNEEEITSLLCGIAHLEKSIHSKSGWFASASRALIEGETQNEEAHRAVAHLSALHRFDDMEDTLGRILVTGETSSCLESMAALLWRGESGRTQIDVHQDLASAANQEAILAVLESLEDGTLDSLDPFLNDTSWQIRASTARLVGHLVRRKIIAAGTALEVLVERMKAEDDSDSCWVLSQCLGDVIAEDPDEGIDVIFGHLCELDGKGVTHELMDALSFGISEKIDARMFEELRDLLSYEDSGGRRALNRCLTWVEDLPPSPFDWICLPVIKSLQWGTLKLPASVAPWFSGDSDIEGHLLTAALQRERLPSQTASLGVWHLNRHPEMMPVWETLTLRSANLGNEDVWQLFSGIIAASRTPSSLTPAELRCALGGSTPLSPKGDPAGVGRLIAIASTPLESVHRAIEHLSNMGDEIRTIASHALSRLPAGHKCPADLEALPPPNGVGPSDSDPAPLGIPAHTSHRPEHFQAEFQPMFGMKPWAWKTQGRLLDGLIVACQHRTHWGEKLCHWYDEFEVRRLIAKSPERLVQQAVAACTVSGVDPLIEAGQSIAALLPKNPVNSPLAPIIALAQERRQQRLGDSPEPPPQKRSSKASETYSSADEEVDRGSSFKIS